MHLRLVAVTGAILVATTGTVIAAAPAVAVPFSGAPVTGTSPAAIVAPAAVQPDYAAGKYFYVCTNIDGSTYTVKKGTSVATGCHGATFVTQYLESGVRQWTRSLSPGGSPAHAKFSGTADCYVAIGVAAFAVLTFEDSWIWYAGTAPTIYGLHACISG